MGAKARSLASAACVAGLMLVASCGGDRRADAPPERTGVSSAPLTVLPAINSSPTISTFVLYAERSVILGVGDHSLGGDIGVAATAPATFGAQLRVGSLDGLDPFHSLFAPSVSLGSLAVTGDIETNSLQNSGGFFSQQAPFPGSTMPLLPLAVASTPGATNVSVAPLQITTLNPGSYGALTDHGVLLLNPGAYSFASVTLGDFAQLQAKPGGATTVAIAGTLAVGAWTHVFPFLQTTDKLTISVAGTDGASGLPVAVAICANSQITALLAAPHGTVSLGDNVQVTGAVSAFDIDAGNNVTLTFQAGFPPVAQGPHGSQGVSYTLPPASPVAGAVDPSTIIPLSLGLPLPNPQALQTLVDQLSDPTNPSYRHWISAAYFADHFAPSVEDYASLVAWAHSNGLPVVTYPDRLTVGLLGTAAQVEQALYVNIIQAERPDGTLFYEPDRQPSVNLSVVLQSLSGLDDYPVPTSRAQMSGSSGSTFLSSDLRGEYLGYGTTPCTNLLGANQSIGIVELAAPFPQDIATYESDWVQIGRGGMSSHDSAVLGELTSGA